MSLLHKHQLHHSHTKRRKYQTVHVYIFNSQSPQEKQNKGEKETLSWQAKVVLEFRKIMGKWVFPDTKQYWRKWGLKVYKTSMILLYSNISRAVNSSPEACSKTQQPTKSTWLLFLKCMMPHALLKQVSKADGIKMCSR